MRPLYDHEIQLALFLAVCAVGWLLAYAWLRVRRWWQETGRQAANETAEQFEEIRDGWRGDVWDGEDER
jgi:hypothetical protein